VTQYFFHVLAQVVVNRGPLNELLLLLHWHRWDCEHQLCSISIYKLRHCVNKAQTFKRTLLQWL